MDLGKSKQQQGDFEKSSYIGYWNQNYLVNRRNLR